MLAISLSEEEFKWLRKKKAYEGENWVAIRIYSQLDEVSYLSKKFNDQFEEILISQFTDIQDEVEENGKIYQPFSEDNYKEIIEFVTKHQDCDKLFVHCHAGVCRSAGVAVGLAKKFDWIESQHGLDGRTPVYPYPNVVSWF